MITFVESVRREQVVKQSAPDKLIENLLVTGGESELGGVLGRLLHDANISVAVQCDSHRHRQDGVRTLPMPLFDPEFSNRLRELQPELILHCHGSSGDLQRTLSPYEVFCVTVERVAAMCEVAGGSAPGATLVLLSPDSSRRGSGALATFSRLAERVLIESGRLHRIKSVILRTGHVFGAGLKSHAVHDLLFRLHSPGNGPVQLPYGENETIDLIHASDLAENLSRMRGDGSAYLRMTGACLRAKDLVQFLVRLTEPVRSYEFAAPDREDIEREDGYTRVECELRLGLMEGLKSYAEWWLGRK